MALSAPVLAPPVARDRVSITVAPPAPLGSRRAQRAELRRAGDLSLDLFSLSYTGMVLYFALPFSADMILVHIPSLFGIDRAMAAELQVQYYILAAITGILSFVLLSWAMAVAPKRRWWHWPLFDSASVALFCGALLHLWGADHLLWSTCWGYLIPMANC